MTQYHHTPACPPTFPLSPFLLPYTLFLPSHSSRAVPESPQLQKGSRAKAQPFSHESTLPTINCLISCVTIDGVPVPFVDTGARQETSFQTFQSNFPENLALKSRSNHRLHPQAKTREMPGLQEAGTVLDKGTLIPGKNGEIN